MDASSGERTTVEEYYTVLPFVHGLIAAWLSVYARAVCGYGAGARHVAQNANLKFSGKSREGTEETGGVSLQTKLKDATASVPAFCAALLFCMNQVWPLCLSYRMAYLARGLWMA